MPAAIREPLNPWYESQNLAQPDKTVNQTLLLASLEPSSGSPKAGRYPKLSP